MSSERDKRALNRDLFKELKFNTYRSRKSEILSDTSSEHSIGSISNYLENCNSEEDDPFGNTVINFSKHNISEKMSSFNAELAIRIIPEFDGSNNFTKFIDMCQYFYNQIDENTELDLFFQVIRLKLCGSAFEIFKQKKFADWKSFQDELNSHYLCSKSPQQLQRDLINTKQLKNESIRSFSNKIENILAELNDSEAEGSEVINYNSNSALSAFVDGIYNSSLKIILKAKGYSKLKDAISLALKEENSFPNNFESNFKNFNQSNYSQNYNSSSFSNNSPVNNFIRKFCSFCNISGHRLEECRSFTRKNQVNSFNPPSVNKRNYEICSYCGVSGHAVENCFKKRRGDSQNVRYFYASNSKNGMSSTEELGVSGMNAKFAENLPVKTSINLNQCPCQSKVQSNPSPEN